MNTLQYIKKIGSLYKEVIEGLNQVDEAQVNWDKVADKGKVVKNIPNKAKLPSKITDDTDLDPVGREDGDIDNDGDIDSTDKYLGNRRKKVTKAVKKDKKKDAEKQDDGDKPTTEAKESIELTDEDKAKLADILEKMGDKAKHTKGATKPESQDDVNDQDYADEEGKKKEGAKEFVNKHKGQSEKDVENAYDKAVDANSKAQKAGPTAKTRQGDITQQDPMPKCNAKGMY